MIPGFAILCLLLAPQIPAGTEIRDLLAAKDYVRAERQLRDGLAQQPSWAAGHLFLAQLFEATGRFADARGEAQTAAKIEASADACLLVARASFALKELNTAIDWLNKAAAIKPSEPEIYKLLGIVYAAGGVRKESAAALLRAAQLAPANWEYHYLAGRALYDLERFADAQREFAKALELNGASVRAWTALGQLQERTHDPAAGESYRKAVELCADRDRECAWPLLELGRVAEEHTNAAGAITYLRRAVAIRPEWAKPHYYLGKALGAEGQQQAARKELETAVRLDGSKPEYFYQLGQVCRQLGDNDSAQRYLRRFREVQDAVKNAIPMELQQP